MALRTRLCDALGIRHPILLAGMGRASTPELAAAVSNAGGLGVLGAAGCGPHQFREWVRRTRALTDGPFGVDTLLPASVRRAAGTNAGGPSAEDMLPRHRRFARDFLLADGLPELGAAALDERLDRHPADRDGPRPLSREFFEAQMEVVIEERVPVYTAGLGMVRAMRPAAEVLRGIVDGAERALGRAPGLLGADEMVAEAGPQGWRASRRPASSSASARPRTGRPIPRRGWSPWRSRPRRRAEADAGASLLPRLDARDLLNEVSWPCVDPPERTRRLRRRARRAVAAGRVHLRLGRPARRAGRAAAMGLPCKPWGASNSWGAPRRMHGHGGDHTARAERAAPHARLGQRGPLVRTPRRADLARTRPRHGRAAARGPGGAGAVGGREHRVPSDWTRRTHGRAAGGGRRAAGVMRAR
jgi:hypothetical protein